jgi:hypothetical protein
MHCWTDWRPRREVDAATKEAEARQLQEEARRQHEVATLAVKRAHALKAEVDQLSSPRG